MTGIQSANVLVDGVLNHILNIRTVRCPSIDEAHPTESPDEDDDEEIRKLQQERHLPYWSKDYEI